MTPLPKPGEDDPSPEPSEDEPLPEWETAIRRAYLRLVDAKIERGDRGHDLVGKLTYESEAPIWLAISDALGACLVAPEGQGSLPNEMVAEIIFAIDTIVRTHQNSEQFKVLVKRGRRHGPQLIEDKHAAVLFLRACKDGLIDESQLEKILLDKNHIDKSQCDGRPPIDWLAEWFGMTEIRSFQRWAKEFADERTEVFRPDDDDDIRAGLIVTLARKGGEHWQVFGPPPKKKRKEAKK